MNKRTNGRWRDNYNDHNTGNTGWRLLEKMDKELGFQLKTKLKMVMKQRQCPRRRKWESANLRREHCGQCERQFLGEQQVNAECSELHIMTARRGNRGSKVKNRCLRMEPGYQVSRKSSNSRGVGSWTCLNPKPRGPQKASRGIPTASSLGSPAIR